MRRSARRATLFAPAPDNVERSSGSANRATLFARSVQNVARPPRNGLRSTLCTRSVQNVARRARKRIPLDVVHAPAEPAPPTQPPLTFTSRRIPPISLDRPVLAAPRRRGSPPDAAAAPTTPRHPRMIGGFRLSGDGRKSRRVRRGHGRGHLG